MQEAMSTCKQKHAELWARKIPHDSAATAFLTGSQSVQRLGANCKVCARRNYAQQHVANEYHQNNNYSSSDKIDKNNNNNNNNHNNNINNIINCSNNNI